MSELRRTVGLWQGVALYVGAVLGTGVLVLPAIAADTAGPASILAWVALVVLSAPLALTYATLSRQRPDAGGFSDAIERAFGSRWGGVAGWLFLAQFPTGGVVAALIAGEYAATVMGAGHGLALLLGGALVFAAYALNFAGLRVSAGAQLATIGVIAVGMVVVIVASVPSVQTAAFVPLAPHGLGAVGLAAVQLFWAFVGWEAITPLAEEFRDPRDIWRASVLALVVVGGLYLALAVVVVGTRAYGPALPAETPVALLASRAFGPAASRLVGVAGFVLCFIPINAYVAGTSRLVYALGRRGQLPRWVGVLSPSGTPRRALWALLAASMLALVVARAAHLRIADLLPLSTSAFVATYVLSMAAAVRLLGRPHSVLAVVALAACLGLLSFVGAALWWVGGVAACSLAYQALARRRAPASPAEATVAAADHS